MFDRVFDLIVLQRYSVKLDSCDLQFGFKKGRSTAMCTMIVKEVIAYYNSCYTNVQCVFLDSSKAFDKIEYCKLFRLLLDRNIPPHVIRVLLNMYTGQQVNVLWNGFHSDSFSVSNGVKQGAIISPILFCVYLDTLLIELRKAGVGCFIGDWFVAALAYADDVILLAPTARAMRTMLDICDRFAVEFNVKFNGNKSKCITFPGRKRWCARPSQQLTSSFVIGGNPIENVSTWSHLGHILSTNLSDDDDILFRRNSFIGQANNFICQFQNIDVLVKNELFKTYCSSHYGSELWDLTNCRTEDYCIAWRKALRKIWQLPYNASCLIVATISNSVPIFDELCRRVMNFVCSCLHCDSDLIRSVASHGVSLGTISPIGRNVFFCAARYEQSVTSVGDQKVNGLSFKNKCYMAIDYDVSTLVNALHEVILIREGLLSLPNEHFNRADINTLIQLLATQPLGTTH